MDISEEKLKTILEIYKMLQEKEEKRSFKEFLEKEKVKKCYECEMYYVKDIKYILPEMRKFEEMHEKIDYEENIVFCKKEKSNTELIIVTKKEQQELKERYNKVKFEDFEESLYKKEEVQENKSEKSKGKEKVIESNGWDSKKEQEIKENWNNWMDEGKKNNWDEEINEVFGEVQYNGKSNGKIEENKKEIKRENNDEWQKVSNKKKRVNENNVNNNQKKFTEEKRVVKENNRNEFNYDEYRENRKMGYERNNSVRKIECVCKRKERYLNLICKKCDTGDKKDVMVKIIKDIKFMMTEFEECKAREFYEMIIKNCNEQNEELVNLISRKEVNRLNEGARKEWKLRLKNGRDIVGKFTACMCVMGENDKRIKLLAKDRICIIHKHIVEKLNGDWHNCESCAKGWYEDRNDEKYWRISGWMKNRKDVEDKEIYSNVYRRYEEFKEDYEDFKEWLGEYDGYHNARREMSKERADKEEYKFGVMYGCYVCGRRDQKIYWVERKYLCYGCRELKWETVKVYMIKRLEKALEDFKEDFEEVKEDIKEEVQEQQNKIEETVDEEINKEMKIEEIQEDQDTKEMEETQENQFEENKCEEIVERNDKKQFDDTNDDLEIEDNGEDDKDLENIENKNGIGKIVIGKIEIFNEGIDGRNNGERRLSV